jgi:hypothetical protein
MIKTYTMVIWNMETGDFKNATQMAVNAEAAVTYGEHFKVINTYEGELPPKVYRSLPYIN